MRRRRDWRCTCIQKLMAAELRAPRQSIAHSSVRKAGGSPQLLLAAASTVNTSLSTVRVADKSLIWQRCCSRKPLQRIQLLIFHKIAETLVDFRVKVSAKSRFFHAL